MDVKITQLPKSQVEMEITIPSDTMQKYMDETAKKLSKQITIQGFRKGEAPRPVVEKHVGEQAFFAEAMEHAVNQAYMAAVQKEGVHAISQPEVDLPEDKMSAESVTFTAKVSVLPSFTLPDYKKIAKAQKREEITIEEKDVEETREYLRKSRANYTEVDRKSKDGDQVVIDYKVTVEGEEIDASQEQSVILGEKRFIPGFEENLEGLKAGEEKSFELTFPEDYGNQKIAGKKATFEIKLHKVSEITLPEWNDDFAKELTGGRFETVDALEENMREGITEEKRVAKENERREAIMNAIIAEIKEELPEVLIESEANNLMTEMSQQAAQYGDTLDAYLERTGRSMDQMKEDLQPQAETRAKVMLTLRKISEEENITVDQEEVLQQVAVFLSRYPEKQAKEIDQERLRLIIEGDLTDKKVLEYLMELGA